MTEQKKALIAMSGGVDSSLAAKLTMDAGYDCIGCTMKLYDNDDIGECRSNTCCSMKDILDAQSVACRIGMPYYVFNFMDGFRKEVIERFVRSYEAGRTPNPCIDCNRYMKFEELFNRAAELGCNYVVTGHYARIDYKDGKYRLLKALDDTKDQSYVLYSMSQEQLEHTMFPLGTMTKAAVRKLAEANQFINAKKPDSQDICFVPDGNYTAFLERFTGKKYLPGPFTDKAGNVLGTHEGIVHYTVGQRKGLGIAFGKPMYVQRIDAAGNTVVLAEDSDLYSPALIAGDFNWISEETPKESFRCKVKIRYRQKEQPASVTPLPGQKVKITFDTPQRAVTPGQAAVLYDGDIVLGGGTIESACE